VGVHHGVHTRDRDAAVDALRGLPLDVDVGAGRGARRLRHLARPAAAEEECDTFAYSNVIFASTISFFHPARSASISVASRSGGPLMISAPSRFSPSRPS